MRKTLLLIVLLVYAGSNLIAQTSEKEARLKAAFIYNFTRYIEWDTTLSETNFTIGIIGTTPVANELAAIAATNKVGNKKIIIRHFDKPEEIERCNILFIPGNLAYPLAAVLDKAGKGMLTISEEPGYARLGVALNFLIINDKLKFESNLTAITTAGLKASSQLLKLCSNTY